MNETPKSTNDAVGGSMMRLVRVFWNDVSLESGMSKGPFNLWLVGDRLFHDNNGVPSYFCGYKENATISDANDQGELLPPAKD